MSGSIYIVRFEFNEEQTKQIRAMAKESGITVREFLRRFVDHESSSWDRGSQGLRSG